MKQKEMSLIGPRSHHLTFGVASVVVCVVMLLYLLHKTHEQLEVTRGEMDKINDKYISLNRQFESLYEYKERLENSFADLKEKKSVMNSNSDSLKSELNVLKQSHRTEIQRLQDELDSCRRHEEMAVVRNQPQRDEALALQQHAAFGEDTSNDKILGVKGHPSNHDIKVISSLSKFGNHRSSNHQSAGNVINFIRDKGVPPPTNQPPVAAQPSVDPNQDPVGNVFI
ncbi:Serine/threonine-protein kinase tel1 [Orchesella cincta]|uniref:Serine/threonine-protein kinase tel1 n=1 Tax=Orchesella cincta TaxID=48709 RepID=A0A1D2N1G2_ORCCI|nr:Serine/threonine-protein kinase tel1 [Orchesella cincta]